NPLPCHFVPHHFWVSKICYSRIGQNRISFIFGPAATFVIAIGKTLVLMLSTFFLLQYLIVMGKYSNKGILSKSCRIFMVHYRTSGKNCSQGVWKERYLLFLPIYKILTDSMSPMHWAPNRTVRIVLVKQMVFAVQINHPIRIIHPTFCRRKVIERAMFF